MEIEDIQLNLEKFIPLLIIHGYVDHISEIDQYYPKYFVNMRYWPCMLLTSDRSTSHQRASLLLSKSFCTSHRSSSKSNQDRKLKRRRCRCSSATTTFATLFKHSTTQHSKSIRHVRSRQIGVSPVHSEKGLRCIRVCMN